MAAAQEENDVDQITALQGATMGTANSPLYCTPVDIAGVETTCAVLKRAPCNNSPRPMNNVCGECLTGYSVVFVPDPLDNSACVSDDRRRLQSANGESCGANQVTIVLPPSPMQGK